MPYVYQKRHQIGVFFGLTHPSQRYPFAHIVIQFTDAVTAGATFPLSTFDQPDTDGVDADILGGVLVGERFGQIDAGGARNRSRQRARIRRFAAHNRRVDDTAAAALAHQRNHPPAAAYGRHQFKIEIALPGGIVDRFERGGRRRAGVVDQDIDAAELCQRGIDKFIDIFGAADIGGNGEDISAGFLADRGGDVLQMFFAPCADRDFAAFGSQTFGGSAAKTIAGPGNHRNLVFKT
jgi:hypothetical protein